MPHWFEPDAEMGQQVEYLRGARHSKQLASSVATYPLLPAMVAVQLFDAPPPPRDVGRVPLDQHLTLATKHLGDARWAVALLSLIGVPGTFVLARRFVCTPWALGATALVAFSFLGLTFAQQGRPHAAAAAFYPWAVAAMIALRERGTVLSYAAAGAACGLALGCLHSALALLPALLVAHVLRGRRHRFDPRALGALAALALSVWLFYPYLFEGRDRTDTQPPPVAMVEGAGLAVGNHVIEFQRFNGAGVLRIVRSLWWYEPALLVALSVALIGAARWLLDLTARRRRLDDATLILLAYLGPYMAVLGVFADTVERFVLPTVPFLAILAARGFQHVESRTGRHLGVRAMWGLAVVFTALCSVRLATLRAKPDTLELAAAWLSENIESESEQVFVAPTPSKLRMDSSIDLPLARSERALSGRGGPRTDYYNLWSRYQGRVPSDSLPQPRFNIEWLAWDGTTVGTERGGVRRQNWRDDARALFARNGPALYVIERQLERQGDTSLFDLQRALERYGERLAVFEPDAVGLPLSHQDRDGEPGVWPHVAWRFLRANSFGPVVDVWRITNERLGE